MLNESNPAASSRQQSDRNEQLEKFISKASDVETARTFVQDAVSVASGLWVTYIGVLVYIAVAVGAVTHDDLFLERPVKLPALALMNPLILIDSKLPELAIQRVARSRISRAGAHAQVDRADGIGSWVCEARVFGELARQADFFAGQWDAGGSDGGVVGRFGHRACAGASARSGGNRLTAC